MAALPVKKLFIIISLGADFLEFHFIQLFHDLLTSAADSHKALAAVFIKLHQHPQCDQTVSTGITAKLRRILITDVPKLPADLIQLTAQADKILFTGMIDEFYDYCYGELEYRSLRFETEVLDMGNYQGNAVVNYTDYEVPYTRIIEHKHFEFGTQPKTVITREYPAAWEKGKEPYYPINDPKNDELFDKYERRALKEKNVLFGGRLGMYRYMDMDKVIEEALNMAETELTYEEV